MLTVGHKFPEFKLTGVVSSDASSAFKEITNTTYKGKWLVVFAWPKDFTFVCPTEIATFGQMSKEFENRGAQVLGMSTDSDYVHLNWRMSHKDLNNLPFPMLSDIKHELSHALGILHEQAGVCLRATFIVDPEGVIRHVSVNDLKVGRNVAEVLRTLDGLQHGGLIQCGWNKGDAPLKAA
jgi:alkyl hydroperoxide reductase subunit AhpC